MTLTKIYGDITTAKSVVLQMFPEYNKLGRPDLFYNGLEPMLTKVDLNIPYWSIYDSPYEKTYIKTISFKDFYDNFDEILVKTSGMKAYIKCLNETSDLFNMNILSLQHEMWDVIQDVESFEQLESIIEEEYNRREKEFKRLQAKVIARYPDKFNENGELLSEL